MPNARYFPIKAVVDVDYDGIPAAIVTIVDGEPLVLLVSEKTFNTFNAVKKKLGFTHIELANNLRESIWRNSGEFCENSVLYKLQVYEVSLKKEPDCLKVDRFY